MSELIEVMSVFLNSHRNNNIMYLTVSWLQICIRKLSYFIKNKNDTYLQQNDNRRIQTKEILKVWKRDDDIDLVLISVS